ncbi:MAG TPA: hypothetical protein VLT45_28060, partial [Kofleriaceae bacterium]|nr:hypothetical protein [Kofleriaceae bacterium]
MKALVVLALLAACKGKHDDKRKQTGSGSAEAPIAWTVSRSCESAIKKAAGAPLEERPQILLHGCQVCTPDWKPILAWNTRPEDGGPPRIAIEKAMLDCHAYCDPNAKQRFLGALDAARGTETRTPWRQLAEVCKDQVSAVPDARFMGGAYFALDRIARAVGMSGGNTAGTLTSMELPLPAVSPSGVGPVLPDVDGVTTPGVVEVTVLGDKVFVGKLPRAHLAAGGVQVDLGEIGYPGAETAVGKLGEALRYALGDTKAPTITLLAPHAMPAQNLVPIVAAAAQ